MINNQGGQVGGGGSATRSHKSLSSHVAGLLQKAAGPGAQESPGCGAPSPTALQLSAPRLTSLTAPRLTPCTPGLAHPAHPTVLSPSLSPEKSGKAFDDGFLTILGYRVDKYELEGSPVRRVGL